ncbi:MAG: dimethylargininase, partial [Acidobacteriota bacterium]
TGCLHLKTGCTAPDDRTVLLNSGWVDPRPFADFRKLEVPASEPFGANVLPLGDGVVALPAEFAETRDLLIRSGFRVESLAISEFLKAEAGLTCMSLCFRDPD